MQSRASMAAPAVKVTTLSKSFGDCKALNSVSMDIHAGEMVALIGSSGSGKSTLLRHIAGFVLGDAGQGSIEVHGHPLQAQGRLAADIRRIRAGIGFVFQQFNLVGRLPVITNVLTGALCRVPLWRSLTGLFPKAERLSAMEALRRVGIADKAWIRASELSGGQQQRAAIARTLVQKAKIILADEPIASLDPESSRRVMEALARINQEDGTTIVVSLHQVDFAIRFCTRTIALKQGVIVYDGPSSALTADVLHSLYGSDAGQLFEPAGAMSASRAAEPPPFAVAAIP
jgi:phosphonate transport system ATP-binding protein